MPVTLVGETGNFGTLGDPTFATGTVPTNGDNVDASVVASFAKRLLDFDAQLASDLNGITDQITAKINAGVQMLRGVASVEALRSLSTGAITSPDGCVCVVREPLINDTLLSRVALYVYDSSSTLTETAIPGVDGAYIVVAPASGVGRWINVSAGVGWQIGASPRFQPRGLKRSGVEKISANGGSFVTKSDTGGFVDLGIVLDLPSALSRVGTEVSLIGSVSLRSGSMADGFDVRLEYSIGGGAWAPVWGSTRKVGGVAGLNNAWIPVSVAAFDLIETELSVRYRMSADFPDSASLDVAANYTLSAAWHWDGV